MKHKRNWVIGIILSATAAFVALQNVAAPTHESETPQAVITITAFTEPSPTSVDNSGNCGYMWAYHDDPELTSKVDESLRQLDPTASARAQLFGEDCIYADGHSIFSVMEIDFYVQLPVDDLTNEEDFGNWVKQVMGIITALPDDSIQESKGFVEFSFIKTEIERIIFRVDIAGYQLNPIDLTGIELFQKYYTPPPPPTTPDPSTPTL